MGFPSRRPYRCAKLPRSLGERRSRKGRLEEQGKDWMSLFVPFLGAFFWRGAFGGQEAKSWGTTKETLSRPKEEERESWMGPFGSFTGRFFGNAPLPGKRQAEA